MIAYIFGYGSLLHPKDWVACQMQEEPIYGVLFDHQRHFKVAIDNLSHQYNKKHYQENNKRVPYFIGTLGIKRKENALSNGLAIPVDERLLARIKKRERSYTISSDIRSFFDKPLDRPLFTFYEKEINHQFYLQGKREKNLFLPRRYLDYCLEGFDHYGGREDFLRLTRSADYPLRDLQFYRQEGAI